MLRDDGPFTAWAVAVLDALDTEEEEEEEEVFSDFFDFSDLEVCAASFLVVPWVCVSWIKSSKLPATSVCFVA
ncbi:hypothetical protein M127_5512 [Bacteroides fragilis str. S6L5]|nr:hypothetical protein M127_5512 [Bacteroides fragilis str. S6L5]